MGLQFSISKSLYNIAEFSLDSLIPNMDGFDCFAKYQTLSVLGIRILIFKCKIYKTFSENLLFGNYHIASIFDLSLF